jgi:hypothetical protein
MTARAARQWFIVMLVGEMVWLAFLAWLATR